MLKKILTAVGIILLIGVIGFVIWGSTPLGPSAEAMAATTSGSGVVVEQSNGWMVFRPQGSSLPATGLIFYPGARVEYRSYAPLLRQVAQQGYLVVLVPQPLNLAIFGVEIAKEVMAAYPQVHTWAMGGHSLGGAMAAQFAIHHASQIQGLVLWAAYPPSAMDQQAIQVVSISGSLDGLATPVKIEESKKLLPAQTTYVVVAGGDHAQFGSYGSQPGDNLAAILPADQWQKTAQATVELLNKISGK